MLRIEHQRYEQFRSDEVVVHRRHDRFSNSVVAVHQPSQSMLATPATPTPWLRPMQRERWLCTVDATVALGCEMA
jgi:hypothetical protein